MENSNYTDNNDGDAVPILIRKIIYQNFNNTELRFTNDEIFEIMQNNKGSYDIQIPSNIDDMEQHFKVLQEQGIVRNIAQNFTTMWFKLFETLDKYTCQKCNRDCCLVPSEEKMCFYSDCRAHL